MPDAESVCRRCPPPGRVTTHQEGRSFCTFFLTKWPSQMRRSPSGSPLSVGVKLVSASGPGLPLPRCLLYGPAASIKPTCCTSTTCTGVISAHMTQAGY